MIASQNDSSTRHRLARLLETIPDEWIEDLLPVMIRIVGLVRRFFAASRYAEIDLPLRV